MLSLRQRGVLLEPQLTHCLVSGAWLEGRRAGLGAGAGAGAASSDPECEGEEEVEPGAGAGRGGAQ